VDEVTLKQLDLRRQLDQVNIKLEHHLRNARLVSSDNRNANDDDVTHTEVNEVNSPVASVAASNNGHGGHGVEQR